LYNKFLESRIILKFTGKITVVIIQQKPALNQTNSGIAHFKKSFFVSLKPQQRVQFI
jgi:hypothetical protein